MPGHLAGEFGEAPERELRSLPPKVVQCFRRMCNRCAGMRKKVACVTRGAVPGDPDGSQMEIPPQNRSPRLQFQRSKPQSAAVPMASPFFFSEALAPLGFNPHPRNRVARSGESGAYGPGSTGAQQTQNKHRNARSAQRVLGVGQLVHSPRMRFFPSRACALERTRRTVMRKNRHSAPSTLAPAPPTQPHLCLIKPNDVGLGL